MTEATDSDMPEIKTSSGGCTGDCFNCGSDVPIGIWDDPALSGKLAIFCEDCFEEPPESNLWEAESDDEEHPLVDIPELPEHKDWIVLDHYRNWEQEQLERYEFDTVEEMKEELDGSGRLGLEAEELLQKPDNEDWEIVVHSFGDTEAIEEAREEVRRLANPEHGLFD